MQLTFWVIMLCAVLTQHYYCQGKSISTRAAGSTEYPCPYDPNHQQWCHNVLPSLIYYNGIIYTADKDSDPDWASHPKQAIVIEDGIIKYVGSTEDAFNTYWRHNTVEVNLYRATILPGIHDVHMHPLEAMSLVGGTCFLPRDKKPADMDLERLIEKCAPKQKGTEWVLGWGHSIAPMLDHIKSGGRPPREILDDALPDTPAIMMEETSHSMWVNSEALRRAGIDANSPDIPGGIIMKDKTTGEPNGILLENAGQFMMEHAMDPNKYPKLEELNYKGLLLALKELAINGITSACDARVYWTRHHHKAWEKALDEDKLTARMILGLWAYPQKDDAEQIQKLKDMYSNDPDSLLRKSQIKVYSDGLIDATTAAVFEPYLQDLGIIPDNMGLNYFPEDRLANLIEELQNVGFDFNIHTIGDRGVYESLNAIERSIHLQDTPRRHRLTHVEMVDELDLHRFKELGVLADAQTSYFTMPSERHVFAENIGSMRAEDVVPVKSLVDAGARVTLSSDWDVSDINPFVNLQNALQREHQSVDRQSAVEMYTINSAYLMRQEHKTGSLVPGKQADLIVVDEDIFKIPVGSINRIKVLQTVLGGKEIYRHRLY